MLIVGILLVEVFFPKQNITISEESNFKKTEKNKAIQTRKVNSKISEDVEYLSNLPVENETIIQITTVTDRKKNAGTDSKVGVLINGNKKKYTRLDDPQLNDYKDGATNSYSLISDSNIQDIKSLTLTINGNDAWLLKKVTVRLFSYSLQKQTEHKFEVNKWFSSEQKDIEKVGAIKSMSLDLTNTPAQSQRTEVQPKINNRISGVKKNSRTEKDKTLTVRTHQTLKELQQKAVINSKRFDQNKLKRNANKTKSQVTENGDLSLKIDEILLLENNEIKLIVDFTKIDSRKKYTDYRCRVYDKIKKKEFATSGRLFENHKKTKTQKNTSSLKDLGSELFITINNHKIEWSNGGPTSAWLYLKGKGTISVLDEKYYETYKFK